MKRVDLEVLQEEICDHINVFGSVVVPNFLQAFTTGFVATNPQGMRVEGVVCCGWLKSCTVRF